MSKNHIPNSGPKKHVTSVYIMSCSVAHDSHKIKPSSQPTSTTPRTRPVEPDLPFALLPSWGRYRLTWMMGCHETKGPRGKRVQNISKYAHDLTGHKFSLKPGIQILIFTYFYSCGLRLPGCPRNKQG